MPNNFINEKATHANNPYGSIFLGKHIHPYIVHTYRERYYYIIFLYCHPRKLFYMEHFYVIMRDLLWPSGYDAWLASVSSQVRVSPGSLNRLTWSLYKCAAFWRAVHGPSATKRSLELFVKIREFLPSLGVSIL